MTNFLLQIQSCPKCQFFRRIKTQAPELHPIRAKGRWDVLGIDLVGPFKETQQKNKYIITVTDLFTKWVVAYPLQDKSGPSVARAIVKMIYTYGPPLSIITDQGREFVNEVNIMQLVSLAT